MKLKPFRIIFKSECNIGDPEIKINMGMSSGYPRARYTDIMTKPPMALVGGGPSAKEHLDVLREWKGDIYAINDMAGFLSDNGIPCYMYAIDGTKVLYRNGPLVKGAIFASRTNRCQYDMFKPEDIQVFDVVEDAPGGICGGGSAACRACHLFIKLGYSEIHYFGIDGCVENPKETHVSGFQPVAQSNMLIVRAGGIDYLTNAVWYIQTAYIADLIPKYRGVLFNRSNGLLAAMIKHPDTWEVVAISHETFDNVVQDHKYETFGIPYTRENFMVGERYGAQE